MKRYCEEVGRDYTSIAKSWSGDVVVGADQREVERGLRKLRAKLARLGVEGMGFEELEGPRLIGTPSEIIDKIERYLKLGVEYFVIIPPDPRDSRIVELFAEKVIPSFG